MNDNLQSCRGLTTLFFCIVFLLTSCAANTENEKTRIQQMNPRANQAAIKVGNEITYPQILVHTSSDGVLWVPLKESSASLDYVYQWNPSTQSFMMVYRDIQSSLHMGSRRAQIDTGEIALPYAPRMIDENAYITITALRVSPPLSGGVNEVMFFYLKQTPKRKKTILRFLGIIWLRR